MTITTTIEDLVQRAYGARLEELENRLPAGYEFTGEFRETRHNEPHLPIENVVGVGPHVGGGKLRPLHLATMLPRLILREKK